MVEILPFLMLILIQCDGEAACGTAAGCALDPGESIVEFFVRGTGHNDAGFIELYSEAAWNEKDCVFIRIPTGAKEAFASAGIPDIPNYFLGHRIQVRGRVRILDFGSGGHACVVADDPARIRRLETAQNFVPSAAYKACAVRDFTLMLAPEVLRHERERAAVIEEVERQLAAIGESVPSDRLAILRRSRIWIEWEAKPHGAAEHHPSERWLRENGYNPDKVGDVEINNVRNFVGWSRQTQPWMLMHELAHAYHDQKRREIGGSIELAYRDAIARRIYDNVPHANGKRGPAYAAKNPSEYFAELTESYFGKNDFWPFERETLREGDPGGYELMREVWGSPMK